MIDALHRVLTGQTTTRVELRVAGAVLMAWFLMDLVQWVDWLHDKFTGACH